MWPSSSPAPDTARCALEGCALVCGVGVIRQDVHVCKLSRWQSHVPNVNSCSAHWLAHLHHTPLSASTKLACQAAGLLQLRSAPSLAALHPRPPQESEGEEAEQSRVELPAEAGARPGARQSRVRLFEVRGLQLPSISSVVPDCCFVWPVVVPVRRPLLQCIVSAAASTGQPCAPHAACPCSLGPPSPPLLPLNNRRWVRGWSWRL